MYAIRSYYGLAIPDEETVEDRLEYSSAKLFLQHAHLARLDFEVGDENFILFLVVTALESVGIFMPMMLTNMFTADCIEYGAYITGQRNEGISFSLQALFSKLTGAFSGYIGMYMLAKIGS